MSRPLFMPFAFVVAGLWALSFAPGCSSTVQDELCSGVTCADNEGVVHGECDATGYHVRCECFPGYHEGTNLTCLKDAECGDGLVQRPEEECDDNNGDDGDGCDSDCTFSCRVAGDCRDINQCNTDSCVEVEYDSGFETGTGRLCSNTPWTEAEIATHCDDIAICTQDGCDPATGCYHDPIPDCCSGLSDCSTDNPCLINPHCDRATGECSYDFAALGAPCTDDGLFCTGAEACDGVGSCVSPGDPCGGRDCVEADGRCVGICVSVTWGHDSLRLDITGGEGTYWFGMAETGNSCDDCWTGEDCVWGYLSESGSYYIYCHHTDSTGTTLTYGGDLWHLRDESMTVFDLPREEDVTYILYSEDMGDCWVWGDEPDYYVTLDCDVPRC